VFCPSVRGLQSILDVCQAYAESELFSIKAKSAKSTVTLSLTVGGQNVKWMVKM